MNFAKVLKQLKQVDAKVLQFSLLLFFTLVIPVSLVHESGHVSVCVMAGHSATVNISGRGMSSTCAPDLQTLQFYVTGPAFGTMAGLAILAFGSHLRRHY